MTAQVSTRGNNRPSRPGRPDVAGGATPSVLPQLEPCPACGSAAFWLSVYRTAHCLGCEPPSAASLIFKRFWLVGWPADPEWTGHDYARHGPDRRSYGPGTHLADSAAADAAGRPAELTWLLTDSRGREWTCTALVDDWPDQRRVRRPAVADAEGHLRPRHSLRFDPALGCGPMGDMAFEDWWESLSELEACEAPRACPVVT